MIARKKIAVLGAGINGLCSALKLLQDGYSVALYAKDLPDHTWSHAASAVWMQFKAHPMDKVIQWLYATEAWCQSLETLESTGIDLLDYKEYHLESSNKPYFLDDIKRPYEELEKSALKHYKSGYQSKVYRLDSKLLLPYLLSQIRRYGIDIISKEIQSFDDAILKPYSVIVNCTGAKNNLLTNDRHAFPIKGQYILTEKIDGLDTIHLSIIDDEKYMAIVPRTHDVWLGGTSESENWSPDIDDGVTEFILTECSKIVPALSKAKIKKVDVGFRSGRTKIRVEAEQLNDGRKVVHNYGQGGSGFSLCWGCAEEVVALIND